MDFGQFFDAFSLNIFGATEWLGVNCGFWLAMAFIILVVAIQNIVFWSKKPYEAPRHEH